MCVCVCVCSIVTTTRRPHRPELASVTFTSGRSYLRLPQWSPGRRGRVEFSFKTIQPHGLMMVTSPSPGRSDFFAVELSDGDLYVVLNLGVQTQRFLIGTGVNDGQPHHVRIDRNGHSLWLTLDNEQLQVSPVCSVCDIFFSSDLCIISSIFRPALNTQRASLVWPIATGDFSAWCVCLFVSQLCCAKTAAEQI